jgi:hypothetical protein
MEIDGHGPATGSRRGRARLCNARASRGQDLPESLDREQPAARACVEERGDVRDRPRHVVGEADQVVAAARADGR